MKLTIVIRDPAPLAIMDEPVGLRRVTITLTDEQCNAITLKQTGTSGGKAIHEQISACFLEDVYDMGDQLIKPCPGCGHKRAGLLVDGGMFSLCCDACGVSSQQCESKWDVVSTWNSLPRREEVCAEM